MSNKQFIIRDSSDSEKTYKVPYYSPQNNNEVKYGVDILGAQIAGSKFVTEQTTEAEKFVTTKDKYEYIDYDYTLNDDRQIKKTYLTFTARVILQKSRDDTMFVSELVTPRILLEDLATKKPINPNLHRRFKSFVVSEKIDFTYNGVRYNAEELERLWSEYDAFAPLSNDDDNVDGADARPKADSQQANRYRQYILKFRELVFDKENLLALMGTDTQAPSEVTEEDGEVKQAGKSKKPNA